MMSNSSDTFKTGERVLFTSGYECLICRSMGKTTALTLEEGTIFPFCPGCGTKDATFRSTGKPRRSGKR